MFRKFNFDTEWAVRLISRITNDEDLPIEGGVILKQVNVSPWSCHILFLHFLHIWHASSVLNICCLVAFSSAD